MTAALADPTELDLAALWRTTYSRVEQYMRTRVPGAAEDLAQETFLRAIAGAATYRPDAGSPEQWLFGIAGRVVADHYRTASRRPVEVYDLDAEAAIPDVADSATDRVALSRAMATLPEQQRAVVAHRYYGDRSVEQTADALGIPAGTVKSACARALRALAKALAVIAPVAPRPKPPVLAAVEPATSRTEGDTGARAGSGVRHHHRSRVATPVCVAVATAPWAAPGVPARAEPPPGGAAGHRLMAGRSRPRPGPGARRRAAEAAAAGRLNRPPGPHLADDPSPPPRGGD